MKVAPGVACVTRIYTSLAVIDIVEKLFMLKEKLPALSLADLQAVTGARLYTNGPVADLFVPEL